MNFDELKLGFLVSENGKARSYFNMISHTYSGFPPQEADVLVVLGGDGFMLRSVQKWKHLQKPFYGVNLGSVGRLLNPIPTQDMARKIAEARPLVLPSLQALVHLTNGSQQEVEALNDVSLFKKGCHTTKLQVIVDRFTYLSDFSGDGILLSTPLGSLSYNYSVGGPILPIQANLLSLMPISPYHPRGWRGALLVHDSVVVIKVKDPERRGVFCAVDNQEISEISQVTITKSTDLPVTFLFDRENTWQKTVSKMQFLGIAPSSPSSRRHGLYPKIA